MHDDAKETGTGTRPGVGVGLFVLDAAGRFVLMRRRGSHGEGTYGLVGGHVEYGQSPQEACVDEAWQELGLRLDPALVALGPYTNDVFPAERKHYVTLFCSCALPEGAVPRNAEPDKCEGFGFFGFDAMPAPLFLPMRNFLAQGRRPPFA